MASKALAETVPFREGGTVAQPLNHAVTLALMQRGSLRLGVLAEHVLQALPRPANMAHLPRGSSALEGVFNYRGQVVPLVDLCKWMATPPDAPAGHAPAAPTQVVVLGVEGRVVAIAVDAINGLTKVPASHIHQVHRDDNADSFFHSVAVANDGETLISLLDPAKLMEQAQAWTTTNPVAAVATRVGGSHGGNTASELSQARTDTRNTPLYAMVRMGKSLVAFPALDVGGVMPLPKLKSFFGRDTHLLGMTRWRERDVPVMNLAKVLDLPTEPQQTPAHWMLVLDHAAGAVSVPVHQVLAVRTFSQSTVQNAPATTASSHLVSGTTVLETGERIYLLDSQAILAMCPLGASGALAEVAPTAAPKLALEHTPTRGDHSPHIVFKAGAVWAASMADINEITVYPESLQPRATAANGHMGNCEWRGQALPVIDLRVATGEAVAPIGSQHRMVVVHVQDRLAGLMVDDVVALLPAHTGLHTRLSMAGDASVHMITVGQAPNRTTYRVMNFSQLAFFT